MAPLGRTLIGIGLLIVVVGVLMVFGRRLPGDIVIKGKNTTLYFPLITCIVVSVVLSFVLWLFGRR